MEPTTGIEPVNLFLTKEVLYQLSYVGSKTFCIIQSIQLVMLSRVFSLERETGFEPATLSLEG